jgi:hypothetical protein
VDELFLDINIVPESLKEELEAANTKNLSNKCIYHKNCILEYNYADQKYLKLLTHYFSIVFFTSYHALNKMILCK